MSAKNNDVQGRFRSLTIAFRVSPEEIEVLNEKVKLSGLTKQDYMIACSTDKDIIVHPNTFVYKSLRNKLDHFIELFQNMQQLGELPLDELEVLEMMLKIVTSLKENKKAQIKVHKESPAK